MEERSTEEQIDELRRARDRGLGEEGRTKEEQDRAMTDRGSGDAEAQPSPSEPRSAKR